MMQYYPYEIAKKKVNKLNLSSKTEFIAFFKENNDEQMPLNPEEVYKDNGWTGWIDFLGIKSVGNASYIPVETVEEYQKRLQETIKQVQKEMGLK